MKKTKDKRIFTKEPMAMTMLRVPRADLGLWVAAADKERVSRAEFMRRALREKAIRTLQVATD
jgi:hypothetical protein